jgi:hypothetical protein
MVSNIKGLKIMKIIELLENIKSYKYREEEGSSFTHDKVTYDLNKVLAMVEKQPLAYIKVEDLKWMLSESSDEERTANADLKAPILVTEWNHKWVTVDGFHRVKKAVIKKVKELPARIVSAEQLEKAKKK